MIGNSFIISIKTNIKAVKKEYLFIGKYIFWKILKLDSPKFFAESSYDSGCFSKLDFIGDFPTAKNLII